ncbi:RluA family pseudouridine synthase [Paenibacillus sinopodophylli]|uniref:RluA family pseudouridine synthase n=1 Tax=Paenibacillus sinopodophylli TaxID=1837342 RepID=UPI00110CA46E|nr:RNA pseudouridine synthase [Paenibacillus sinopodophylli]
MSIPILFEDNQILVVIKPPGILSQEDDTGDADMLTLLKQDLKERYNKPGNVFLGLVHRLDRMVGGVMIFAKTSKAASRLSESVRSRQFGKTYVCVVQGTPNKPQARLTHYIRKDNKQNQVTVFNKATNEAKEAILDYEVAAVSGRFSLISVKLHTGRPHQIRAQLAHIGCPLVGDLKYGGKPNAGINEIALWSTSVSAPHPVSKEWMSFRALPSGSDVWTWWTTDQLEAASIMLSQA